MAHPTTGEVVQLTVTPDVVNVTVRMMLYADETRAVLPAMLRATQVAPLAAMAISTTSQLEGTIHTPVNLAIICAEDVPFMTNTPLPPDAAFDDERPGMKKACALFDAAKVEPFRPKSITPPTLMLSGEHDPITPPHHAKRSEGVFANLHHLVLKGQGHCMTVRGCAPKLIAEAIAAVDHNVSYDTVDASCLDKLPPFPRFIDALGPAP